MQPLLGPISYPILIQGPPGTGKTHTLSSMILAIMLAKSDQLVHICAPSNAAMREVAVRLLRDAAHTRILHPSEILLFGTEQKIDLADGIDAIYFNSRLERGKTVSKRLDDLKSRVLSARQDNPEGRQSTWHTDLFSPLKDLAEEGIEVLTILGNDFVHKDVDGWKGIPLCVDLLTRWKRDLNAVIGNKPPNVGVVLEKLESMLDDISMTISNDPEVLEQAFVESTKVFFSTVNSAGGKILDMFVGRSRLIILDEGKLVSGSRLRSLRY
jgi:Rad3-related DNA helicase